MDENKLTELKELTRTLAEAARAYYRDSREIMSNLEYDSLYDRLVSLEKELGVTLAGSPTEKVGYELSEELPKENHEKPMLSLDKTKDKDALSEWLGDKTGLLSWKMDGITIVLTYENGSLTKAVTRGNGVTGEVVLKGTNVTSGYLNNPEANQESFKNGWFYTGDLGFFDKDGYLFLTGRRKELINRGGEKISPREVDEVLYQLSEVETAVTVGVPDALFGEEVIAFIQ